MSYAIITSSAKMPASCWGRYVRLGVVELEPGCTPADVTMLSDRSRAVRRVVQTWERLHSGRTDKDAHSRALREAEALRDRLNTETDK